MDEFQLKTEFIWSWGEKLKMKEKYFCELAISQFSISLALLADNQYQITMGIYLKLAIRASQGES